MEPLDSSPEEVQAAINSFKAIGGRIEKRYRWGVVEGRRHLVAFDPRTFATSSATEGSFAPGLEQAIFFFVMPASTQDKDLKSLPLVPFPFGLDLRATLVTDGGLGELARMKTLSALGLNWTAVTGTGLADLADLHDLESLDLSESSATDNGLQGLTKLHGLSALDLSQTKVTDAGLRHIGALHRITWLSLSGSFKHWGMFTDAGLAAIATLKDLSVLVLGLSKVTESGVGRLQVTLPNCCVSRSYAGSDWEVTTKVGPA
jgi:hypothetical protein